MRILTYLFILAGLVSSCQFFDTEKISSETFYEEEFKSIDWENVDRYPAFPVCEQFTEKEMQKECFENTLSQHVYASIGSRNMITNRDLNDTVYVVFGISKDGVVATKEVRIDSTLVKNIPLLKGWLEYSIDSLPESAPAYKRGIPVETQFILPVILKTERSTN